MKEKNPVMLLFPIEKAKHFSNKYLFIGRAVSRIIFSLKYDLEKAEIEIEPEKYGLAALLSAAVYAVMFSFIGIAFGIILNKGFTSNVVLLAVITAIGAFVAMLLFHLIYPKMAAVQLANAVDQELLFALRTLLIQLSSGVSLFESMRSISKSNYGQVSEEFAEVVKEINSGSSESAALEKLAFKTKSDILKKTLWQVVITMKSGGSIVNALNSQVDVLVAQQREVIKNYSASLNLWTLVYLIIAAAMPSLGVTFLVIASSIGGAGIGKDSIVLIAVMAFAVQIVLIFLIKEQVPKVIK